MAGVPVITIDGPVGSGKTIVARMLAQRLGYEHIDAGIFYRAIAVAMLRNGIDPCREDLSSPTVLERWPSDIDVKVIDYRDELPRVHLNGLDVTEDLQDTEIWQAAASSAGQPIIRRTVWKAVRSLRKPPGIVASGRDMGAAAFPDATVKVLLTDLPEVRAIRRHEALRQRAIIAGNPSACPLLGRVVRDILEVDESEKRRNPWTMLPDDGAYFILGEGRPPVEIADQIAAIVEQARAA